MRGGERPVSSLVGRELPVARLCMVLATIEREWRRIVGDAFAGRSAPASYADGVLCITVDSQAVLHGMNFKKNEVIREIRAKARLSVADVKIEIGRVRRANALSALGAPAPRRRPSKPPTIDEARAAALRDEILSQHADIDPELALRIARARAACEVRERRPFAGKRG